MAERGREFVERGRTTAPGSDAPTPDLDQSAVSAERTHRVADRAEVAATEPLARGGRVSEPPVDRRDHLQGTDDGSQHSGSRPAGSSHRDADRRRRTAERAYYKAERRGFAPGHEQADWIEAEREIDAEGPTG